MSYQALNYDFISQAGEQASKAITAYDVAKKMNLDNTKAEQAHTMLLEAAKQKYKEATGETDDVKATSFAARYFPGKYNGESALDAVSRWEKADPQFETALKTLKVKKFHETPKEGGQAMPQGVYPAGGMMEAKQEATPKMARKARLAGEFQPTTQYERPAFYGRGELPGDRPEAATMPPLAYNEQYAEAERQGIIADPTVQAKLTKTATEELGSIQWPEGTTKEQVFQAAMQRGYPLKDAETYANMFSSQKDLMTNERLKLFREKADALALKRMALQKAIADKKLGQKADYDYAKTQLLAIDRQLDRAKIVAANALGFKTGTDLMGQTQFVTDKKWQDEMADLETTGASIDAILKNLDQGSGQPNPVAPAVRPTVPTSPGRSNYTRSKYGY